VFRNNSKQSGESMYSESWRRKRKGCTHTHTHTHTHPFNDLCPGLPRWAGTRKEKPIWILLKQETVSGSGIDWVICKSAPRSRQITTPVPHHSVFYRPDALPAAQPTASKHWRQRKGCSGNDLQKRKVLSLEWKSEWVMEYQIIVSMTVGR